MSRLSEEHLRVIEARGAGDRLGQVLTDAALEARHLRQDVADLAAELRLLLAQQALTAVQLRHSHELVWLLLRRNGQLAGASPADALVQALLVHSGAAWTGARAPAAGPAPMPPRLCCACWMVDALEGSSVCAKCRDRCAEEAGKRRATQCCDCGERPAAPGKALCVECRRKLDARHGGG